MVVLFPVKEKTAVAFYQKYDLHRGPFVYYVIKFLGFLDPPPPLHQHVFSTKNKQKLAFSDPPSPPTSDYVIYEWSLGQIIGGDFAKFCGLLRIYKL